MKVVNVSEKEKFVPVNVTVTFESRKEVMDFFETASEVLAEGYIPAGVVETVLIRMKEELSK